MADCIYAIPLSDKSLYVSESLLQRASCRRICLTSGISRGAHDAASAVGCMPC